MSNSDHVQARVIVMGRVQGVFFRKFVQQRAIAAGISGYVRNLPDGQVEAVFQGPSTQVHDIIVKVHSGPSHARVDRVSVNWEPVSKTIPESFRIRY